VLLLAGATTPTVESLAERSFTGHMVQHLTMIVLAAPLLVISRPVEVLGSAGRRRRHRPGPVRRRMAQVWRRRGAVLAPLAFAAVLVLTHLTAVYDVALTNRWVHEAEHVAYAGAAIALWAAVRGTGTHRAFGRIAAVFAVIACTAFVGVVLISAGAALVPTYEARLGATEALADQRRAAALMWVTGMLTTLPLLLLAVWRWADAEERAARRSEALADGTRPVPPRRRQPASSAG
jgi:putative membrane protein